MMRDQRDSDAEESIDEPEENEEVNESDGDDTRSLPSDDDSGEENIDSDDDDDNDSEGLTLKEMRKFICTFIRGNYEDKIDNALCRGADRPLSTTADAVIIGLYDKPADWMERNAVGLEKLKWQLQQCIRMAEDGEIFSIVLGEMQIDQSDAPVVWHDPSINPYWEKLTTACRNPTRESLRIHNLFIDNVEMRKETVAALLTSLHGGIWMSPPQPNNNHSICCVNFANTNLCGEGLVSLSSFMEQSPGLRLVRLSHNRIGGMNSAMRLSRALKPHPNMKMLIITHCDLGNDPDILSVILQSDVKEIDLSHNYIDSLGAVKISEYLESNPPVKLLKLDNNSFNDDDAILFSQALKRNTDLTTLGLTRNNFTSTGVKVLFSSHYDSSSLNAISESNHTCELDLFDNKKSAPIQQMLTSLKYLDRTSKILIALHDKESLLKYLADVPVELMPDVMAFIQEREWDQIQSMSMMYAAMRWWNMPSLYSFLRCDTTNTKRKRVN